MPQRTRGDAHDGDNVLLGVWSVARATSDLLEVVAASGITADEFGIYSILAKEGPLTPTDLSRRLAAPPTTISSLIARFERRQHVRRAPNPADGRSSLVGLTPLGRRVHRRAAKLYVPALGRVEQALGDQEPAVRQALAALRAALDEARTTGPRPPA